MISLRAASFLTEFQNFLEIAILWAANAVSSAVLMNCRKTVGNGSVRISGELDRGNSVYKKISKFENRLADLQQLSTALYDEIEDKLYRSN